MEDKTTTIQLQPQSVYFGFGPSNASNFDYSNRHSKKWLLGLGISEVVVGFICIIIGSVLLAHQYPSLTINTNCIREYQIYNSYNQRNVYSYNSFPCLSTVTHDKGEGIWAGIMIIAAGGLAIAASRENASVHLTISHFAIALVACITTIVGYILVILTLSLAAIFLELFFVGAFVLLVAGMSFTTQSFGFWKIARIQYVYGLQKPYEVLPAMQPGIALQSQVQYSVNNQHLVQTHPPQPGVVFVNTTTQNNPALLQEV